jgi:hypothetical protein
MICEYTQDMAQQPPLEENVLQTPFFVSAKPFNHIIILHLFISLVKSQKACHCDLPAIGFALGKAGWAERSNPWPRPEPHGCSKRKTI